jgi:hypothetical protein
VFELPSLVIATHDLDQVIPQIAVAIGRDGEALFDSGIGLLEQVIDLLSCEESSAAPFVTACRILLARAHTHLLAGNLLIRGGFVVDATLSARATVETLWLLDYLHLDRRELRHWLHGDYISAARVRNALSDTGLRHQIYDELCAQSHPNQIGLLIYTTRPGQLRSLSGERGSIVPFGAMRFYTLLLLLNQALVQCYAWLSETLPLPQEWEEQMLVMDDQIISFRDRLFLRAEVPQDVGRIAE